MSRFCGWPKLAHALPFLLVIVGLSPPARAYAVLTHEAIIDTVWDDSIKPLLLKKYPGATPDELIEAHAYAYGGCIIQDMGYYPFGSKFFSDLVHYVSSGDFVVNMVKDAQNLNEYAFALGTLAHYAADNEGHPVATNRVVPMLYPKLRAKFGKEVTYEDNPTAHLRTEFGFDVVQVAQGKYAPKAYHDFIGFKVSKEALDRGFQDTYGIPLKSVFKKLDLALGTYRHAVGAILPELTKAAWASKKDQIAKDTPGMTRQKFLYNLSRSSYEKEWGVDYSRPGAGARFLAFLFRLLPKVGPFRALAFRPPTQEGERMFMDSFNKAVDLYRKDLREVDADNLHLADENFDLGRPAHQGEYRMADATYEKLIEKLKEEKLTPTGELKRDIDRFYNKGKS